MSNEISSTEGYGSIKRPRLQFAESIEESRTFESDPDEYSADDTIEDKILDRLDDTKIFILARLYAFIFPTMFLVFLLISAAIMSHYEEWAYLDSFRFIIVTITSTGYGDLTPTRLGTKLFMCFFILFGFIMFAMVIGTIAGSIQVVPEDEYSTIFGRRVHRIVKVVLLDIILMSIAVAVGMAFYTSGDQLTPSNAFYFSIITLASVGYGESDIMSKLSYTDGAQVFSIFYILVGVACFGSCFGQIASVVADLNISRQIAHMTKIGATKELIRKLDVDGNSSVDLAEFMQVMLVEWGRCQKRDIDQCIALFRKLDPDGSGTIDPRDIKCEATTRKERRLLRRKSHSKESLQATLEQFWAEQAAEEAAEAEAKAAPRLVFSATLEDNFVKESIL